MNLPSRFYFFAAAATVFIVASCSNQSAMNESTASVKHITQADFEMEVTRCTNPVVADFYATWCGPCRVLSPMLDRLAGGYADKVKFVKINVDESPGIAQNFQAEELPLVIFFRDGKVADRLTNMPTESDLKARLDAFYAGK
jgi:thioredoxin